MINFIKLVIIFYITFCQVTYAAKPASGVTLNCSATNSGNAVLNEINTSDNFIEIYLLATSDIFEWTLYEEDNSIIAILGQGNCQINGTAQPDNASIGLTSTTWPAGTIIACDIDANPAFDEILLTDNATTPTNNDTVVIDYLGYGPLVPSAQWTVDSACRTLYPEHEAQNRDMARIPDGTGDIQDNGNNSTKGTPNNPLPLPIPIADYRFDEITWSGLDNEVLDSSANQFHGKAIAGANTVAGLLCSAAKFNSTNRVEVVNNSLFEQIGQNNSDYSVSFWLNLDSSQTTDWRTLVHKGNSNRQRTFSAWLRPNNDNRIHYRASTVNNWNEGIIASSIAVPQEAWTFITLIKEGRNLKIYFNGILDSQVTIASTIANNGPLYIGRSPWHQGMRGLMDELLIFNNALSASQINSIYNNNLNHKNWDGSDRSCQPQNDIDHFELHYSPQALTCSAADITVKACMNTDCSALFTDSVTVDLSPVSGWSSNPATFSSGEQLLSLQDTTPGNVVIDILNSSIVANNPVQCFANNTLDANCTITFSDSSFVITMPILTSCKTATGTIKAVSTDPNTNTCKAALSGNRDIYFWNNYETPNTGTTALTIENTDIASSSPGTAVNIQFSADGEANFDINYADAGQLSLSAAYTAANGKTLSGTSSPFVSVPVALATYSNDTNADCASNGASCSKFKKAGETFNLKVNAACWTHDGDSDFTDNPVTPNFALNSIVNNHTLVAPAGGINGAIDVTSFNFSTSDNGTRTISQAVSEVGVFTFGISPPSYFGETLTTVASPSIGRFYPDHFKATTLTDGAFGANACTGFSYSGQPFTYQTPPQLTITAYNAATPATITQNYTSDFAKLIATDFNITAPTTDAIQLGADNTNLVGLTWSADVASLTDNSDGSLTFSLGNDDYSYLHEANSRIAPFSNVVNLVFTVITDSDSVQTQGLPHTLQPTGEDVYFGRINIDNAHGSELVPLPIVITAEYFNGVDWTDNTADQCTILNLPSHIQLSNPETGGGSWQTGNTTMNIASGTTSGILTNNNPLLNGQATLTLSAPGEDNQGYVDIRSQLFGSFNWLLGDFNSDGVYGEEPSARASFGLFKGSDNIIFRREVY